MDIALFRNEDQNPRTASGIQSNLLKYCHLTHATGKLRWSVWTRFNSKLTAHRLLGSLRTDRNQRVYNMADQNMI